MTAHNNTRNKVHKREGAHEHEHEHDNTSTRFVRSEEQRRASPT